MVSRKGIKWVFALLICNSAVAVPAPAIAGLFGPGKFKIEQIDDRFSTGSTVTVTEPGTSMGFLPMRDIASYQTSATSTHAFESKVCMRSVAMRSFC